MIQDILGPMCFDYGFGPFRWVCASGKAEDLAETDRIACEVLEDIRKNAPAEIQQQMADNIKWIKGAQENKLVVGLKLESYMLMPKDELKSQRPSTIQLKKEK